jgi:hypothetical protein
VRPRAGMCWPRRPSTAGSTKLGLEDALRGCTYGAGTPLLALRSSPPLALLLLHMLLGGGEVAHQRSYCGMSAARRSDAEGAAPGAKFHSAG